MTTIRPKITEEEQYMFVQDNGAKEITIKDIEDFLNSDGAVTPAAKEDEGSPATQPNDGDGQQQEKDPTKVTETQAFAHRLKEETIKARNEERDNIAKSLGYESYADMQKKRETEMLKEKGLDPEEVSPVVEEIVNKRLAEDPRLKELETIRQKQVAEWAKQELAELSELTGGKVSKLEDVPKDVIELWKTKGSLKAAYLELQGEALIREARAGAAGEQSRGSTGHLKSPAGTTALVVDGNKRPLTAQEKELYKLFNPEVTEEQLSKMTKNK